MLSAGIAFLLKKFFNGKQIVKYAEKIRQWKLCHLRSGNQEALVRANVPFNGDQDMAGVGAQFVGRRSDDTVGMVVLGETFSVFAGDAVDDLERDPSFLENQLSKRFFLTVGGVHHHREGLQKGEGDQGIVGQRVALFHFQADLILPDQIAHIVRTQLRKKLRGIIMVKACQNAVIARAAIGKIGKKRFIELAYIELTDR